MRYQVKCINKNDRDSAYERIEYLGGVTDSNKLWRFRQEDVIAAIEKGFYFYVLKNNQVVKLIVAISKYGNKYVKTVADDELPNNLLELPECR